MTHQNRPGNGGPLIFISAAEQSADTHGASLIHAARAQRPGVRFVGVAGPKMVEAGCHRIFDMTQHAAMLLGAVKVACQGARMLRTSEQHLRRYPFDAAVVIDSPTLHLPLAGRAHAAGIPVMYYIAPQMWAWGGHRIHKLRNNVDRVAVILPFEERFFREQGVDARFVGHPIADRLASLSLDEGAVGRIRAAGSPVVALLPGSRRHVVEAILPGQLEVATRIAQAMPKAAFAVSVANAAVVPEIERQLVGCGLPISTHADNFAEVIHAADLVLVASGTSALDVAYHGRPMIVMYKASRLFYHAVARWMIRTPYLSLPNILAGREIVPEFMPYYVSTVPIAVRALELLQSPELRDEMTGRLEETVAPLRDPGASERAAAMLLDLIDHQAHS